MKGPGQSVGPVNGTRFAKRASAAGEIERGFFCCLCHQASAAACAIRLILLHVSSVASIKAGLSTLVKGVGGGGEGGGGASPYTHTPRFPILSPAPPPQRRADTRTRTRHCATHRPLYTHPSLPRCNRLRVSPPSRIRAS